MDEDECGDVPFDSDEEAANLEEQEEEVNQYMSNTLNNKVGIVVDTMMRANTVFNKLNET